MKLSEQYNAKTYGTDKNTTHCYIDYFYNDVLRPDFTDILEIGAAGGGSALLWQDYFTNANIDTIEINQCEAIKNQPRIKHILANAYCEETIKNLREYDVIIDDGPHTLDSMIYFVENYTKLLKVGGIAIIEDIQSVDWFGPLVSRVPNNCFFHIIDLRNVKNQYDDLLLMMKRIK